MGAAAEPSVAPVKADEPLNANTMKGYFSAFPKSSADGVLPRHRAAMPDLEAIRASTHHPVLVTPDPGVQGQTINGSSDIRMEVPINGKAFEAEGKLFKGKYMIHINNLPTTDGEVFAGKKRLFHISAQGQFKRTIKAAKFLTGQEFHQPVGHGLEWISEHIMRFCAKIFSKTTIVSAYGDQPHFLNPVLAACQRVNISRAGEEPDLWTAPEDCRLLSPELADASGAPIAAEKRRKWCDDPANVKDLEFTPDLVYTFHMWQHVIDVGGYKINLGLANTDMTWILRSQPIGFMCKEQESGDYGYSLLAWHERLLYPEEYAASQKEANRGKALADRFRSFLRV